MSKALKNIKKKLEIKDYGVALSYCRVSSLKQETDGSGLDSQETRNEQLAGRYGLRIEKVFRDTYTGSGDFMKRPAMSDLISHLDSHPYKKYVVIFDDLKRFARDTRFHFELRTALDARNVLPLCHNFIFEDSPEGKFVETIHAAQNELERSQNRRQVIEKQKACLERGYWPFRSLYGYNKGQTVSGKQNIPNEDNKYIKELFDGFALGHFQHLVEGAVFLKDVGVLGKRSPEKYITTVKNILKQPFYAGFIEYPAWEVSRFKGDHEPTVTTEIFEAVQKKISRSATITKVRQDISPDFPLRQLINCSVCAKKLTGAWSRSGSSSKKRYPYYFCQNKHCVLKGSIIRKKDLEDKFSVLLKEMTTENDIIELAKVVFMKAQEKDEKEYFFAVEIKNKRKKECEAEIERYAKLAGQTKIVSVTAQYERLIEKIAGELEQLEGSDKYQLDYSVPYRTALDKVMGILKNPCATWEELNVFEKQKFFGFLFEQNLSYDKKDGYRTPKYTVLKRVCEEIQYPDFVVVELGGIEPPCS